MEQALAREAEALSAVPFLFCHAYVLRRAGAEQAHPFCAKRGAGHRRGKIRRHDETRGSICKTGDGARF
ncbi:hypothetical protein HYT45_04695 [Candidatus Uhrbacteria bacterium]|nr:hypothetical protein [Candidatus Uhrbacteria bacterium]